MDGYSKQTLKNGLRLISVPMEGVASATVMILVGAGSRYEKASINGISHFLEHMAFKGTATRPSALVISSLIEGIGGEFNAFTSKDHTAYYIKAAKKHLPLLFDILSDMLLHSKFDKDEIEREKGVITEEINLYEDTPMRRIGTIFEELLYGNHPLGWDIAGKKEVIQSLKRDDFISYVDGLYAPNNTIVSVSGAIGKNGEVMDLAQKWLGNWKKRDVWQFKKVTANNRDKLRVVYKKTEQAHLCLGVPSFDQDHPDHYVLEVLAAILGGGMSSRLFIEVRERRGLAYYVRTDTTDYHETGNLVTQAGVDLKRIDDAIKVILSEYERITEEPVATNELTKAKEFLKGRLILEMEDSKNIAALYGTQALLNKKIDTAEDILSKINKVTVADITRVAKIILKPSEMRLAVIGPFKDSKRFAKLIK